MTQEIRLVLVFVLNFAMIAVLVVVGLSAHSLGVLAAGGDYFADAIAIGISIFALRMSKHPHGHPRATTFAALVNSLFLLTVLTLVALGAVQRLITHTPKIEGLPVLIVCVVAAPVMIGCALILRGDKSRDLNTRSILLDTVADAASAIGVAIAGGIILVTGGLYWLDSVVALVISLVIGYSALKLLRDTIFALRKIPAETVMPGS